MPRATLLLVESDGPSPTLRPVGELAVESGDVVVVCAPTATKARVCRLETDAEGRRVAYLKRLR